MKKVSLKNKDTFNHIFEEYYSSLVSFACNYLNNNQANSEDIVQNTFYKLIRKNREFSDLCSLVSYLFISVKNSCLNHNKHLKVKDLHIAESMAIQNTEEFFLSKVLEEEVSHLLNRAIEELPERCRKIFELTLNGLKNPEIASQMQISVTTVKSQKMRGKKILRELLRHQYNMF